jgi:hypothetical protein
VATIRELQHEQPSRPEDPGDLREDHLRVAHVEDQANCHHDIHRGGCDREVGGVCLEDREAGIGADSFPGRPDHRRRCVDQGDMLEPAVLVGEAAEAGPEVEKLLTGRRQQRAEGEPVAQVLVRAGGPEGVPVGEVVRRGLGARTVRARVRRLLADGIEVRHVRQYRRSDGSG